MPDGPVLSSVNLVTGDMEAGIAFYRLLGVSIPDEAVWRTASGPHHLDVTMANGMGLDLDSPELARRYNAGFGAEDPRSHTVLTFGLPSRDAVDEAHARLVAAGHPSMQDPYDAFWGARYAIVADPDGRHIGLMSTPDPARRSAPPDL